MDQEIQQIILVRDSYLPAIIEFLMTSWQNKTHQQRVERRYKLALQACSDFLEMGVQLGRFHPILSTQDIAKVILTFIDGLTLTSIYLSPEQIGTQGQMNTLKHIVKPLLGITTNNTPH
nr:hypothetical protein [Paenibacillus shirakamiensis]